MAILFSITRGSRLQSGVPRETDSDRNIADDRYENALPRVHHLTRQQRNGRQAHEDDQDCRRCRLHDLLQ